MDKFLIVGYGGAGKRALNILSKVVPGGLLAVWNTGTHNEMIPANVKIIKGLEQALEFSPTGVFIATPTSRHVEYAEPFLNITKWILIDKPLDADINRCEIFSRNAKYSSTNVYINFQRRYMPCWLRLKALLAEIDFGKLEYGIVRINSFYPDWRPNKKPDDLYAARKELGGGVLLTECHELDLINWLLGPVTQVIARESELFSDMDVEYNAQMMVDISLPYGHRNIVFILDDKHKPCERSIELVFQDKTVVVEEDTNKITVFDKCGEILLSETTIINNPHLDLLKEVVSMTGNPPTLSEGLWTNAIIHAAKKSIKNKKLEVVTPSVCPNEGVAFLNEAIDLLNDAFKERLISVYGLGSLGYGGYVTGWSDFDIDVFVDSDYEQARTDYRIGKEIETIIKSKGFDRIDIRVYDFRHLNERKTILEYGQCSRATMLCDSAVLLMGKDVRNELLRPTLSEQNKEAYNLLEHMLGFSDDWWNALPWDDIAAHFALTARFLYTKDTGKVAGKQKALEYVLDNYSSVYDTEQLQWILWALAMRMQHHPLMIQNVLHANAVSVLRRTFENVKIILAGVTE